MARYIDADKVMEEINRIGGHNLCEWETIGVKALIDRQPTADVVPKSEVALKVIHQVKNKVRKYKHNVVNPYEHIILYLNELEKKYTEGE